MAPVDNDSIDKINILPGELPGRTLALDALSTVPEFLLIDGNRFRAYKKFPHRCIVKVIVNMLPLQRPASGQNTPG